MKEQTLDLIMMIAKILVLVLAYIIISNNNKKLNQITTKLDAIEQKLETQQFQYEFENHSEIPQP